jgi:hypothetical protein
MFGYLRAGCMKRESEKNGKKCLSKICLFLQPTKNKKEKKKKIHFHKKIRHLGNTQMCVFP